MTDLLVCIEGFCRWPLHFEMMICLSTEKIRCRIKMPILSFSFPKFQKLRFQNGKKSLSKRTDKKLKQKVPNLLSSDY